MFHDHRYGNVSMGYNHEAVVHGVGSWNGD